MNRIRLSLLLPAIILVLISLATFYSIDTFIFRQQIIFLVLGLICYVVFLNIDYRFFAFYARYIYILALILFGILFISGVEAKGAVRWIDVFGLRLQFSEIFKPFLVLCVAQYLSKSESRSISKFIMTLLFFLPIFIFTLKQPDLGNAMIYFMSLVFILFVYGFPISYFVTLGMLLFIPLPFFFQLLHDYQKQRILSFLGFNFDPFGSSYNAIQSVITVGSGGVFGKGLGQATQSVLQFLPEKHTDFIFATITESLGLIGGLALLALYFFILYKILAIYNNLGNQFLRLTVIGFFFLLLSHIFLNIGMNIGILPIVGVTLPFVSYGGSSLITNFIILGIISAISFESKDRDSIEIR